MTYPQIESATIELNNQERTLLQQVYKGYARVMVEKEFGSGYSGMRVLLTCPVGSDGRDVARKITKLGPALELRQERDNYERNVRSFLPFCAARVDEYYEQDDEGVLNYVFVGDGALGQVVELEECYRKYTAKRIKEILDVLLIQELGERYYGKTTPLPCFFAAEYGRHLIERLCLKLRPASTDTLWLVSQEPTAVSDYQQLKGDAMANEHETVQTGTLLSVDELVIQRIKRGEINLENPAIPGAIVRVKFAPESNVTRGLRLGSRVGVRGQVVHNDRHGQMQQIVRKAFPALADRVDSECIELPDVPGVYPNPLSVYPRVLGMTLRGRRSYVHGDLHLRNVLVDEGGRCWLIDFALVEERHNLFDFIKLETFVRLTGLAEDEITFSHGEYAQFEKALTDATLGKESGAMCPDNSQLEHAYQVILAIRQIAQRYMAQRPNAFLVEYLPALFLYCLAVIKYYKGDEHQPTQLVFVTACVLSCYLGISDQADPMTSDVEVRREASRDETVATKETQAPVQEPTTADVEIVVSSNNKGVTVKIKLSYLRDCLVESFANTGEIYDFCQDNLCAMLKQWPEHAEIGMLVRKMIAHCQAREQLDILYDFLAKERPGKYKRYYQKYGEEFDHRNRLGTPS